MKFLILKTSSLGDIIHLFPTVEYLREKFPYAQIDWVVEKPFAELVRAHPLVDNAIVVDTRKWRKRLTSWAEVKTFFQRVRKTTYDVAFDLQGNIKSALLLKTVLAKEKVGFGRKSVPEWPNLFFTDKKFDPPKDKNIREDYLFVVQSFLEDKSYFESKAQVCLEISDAQEKVIESLVQGKENPILVSPGAFWPNKELSLSQLVTLLKDIHARQKVFFFFSWGRHVEKEVATSLAIHFPENSLVLEKMALPMLQNLMSRVSLVIAMDSLPLHLAGTTGTKTLSFFGPSLAKKYRPLGPQHQVMQGSCPYGETFDKRCSKLRTCKSGACIKTMSFNEESQYIFGINHFDVSLDAKARSSQRDAKKKN